jgi:hypothetical protein
MQPQHRTHHVTSPHVQTISIPEIDRRHPDPLPPVITLVVFRDLLVPELPDVGGAIFAKPNVDQEIGVLFAGYKVWRRLVLVRPKFTGDASAEWFDGVPAP